MTTRKFNAVAKLCNVARYSNTFAAIIAALQRSVDVDRLTAAQIAALIDFAYAQKEHGYNQAAELL